MHGVSSVAEQGQGRIEEAPPRAGYTRNRRPNTNLIQCKILRIHLILCNLNPVLASELTEVSGGSFGSIWFVGTVAGKSRERTRVGGFSEVGVAISGGGECHY